MFYRQSVRHMSRNADGIRHRAGAPFSPPLCNFALLPTVCQAPQRGAETADRKGPLSPWQASLASSSATCLSQRLLPSIPGINQRWRVELSAWCTHLWASISLVMSWAWSWRPSVGKITHVAWHFLTFLWAQKMSCLDELWFAAMVKMLYSLLHRAELTSCIAP